MKNIVAASDYKAVKKTLAQSIIITVVSIFLCAAMLCSLTYAWLNADVSNNANKLEAGHFSLDYVSVINAGAEQVSPDQLGYYALEEGEYTVTLYLAAETTVRGYCVITVNGIEYRTEVIVNDETRNEIYSTPNAPFTFKLEIPEEGATLKIESRWGVPAAPDLYKDGVITVAASQTENG